MTDVKLSTVAIATAILLISTSLGQAQDFNGWCFDGGECTGTVSISGNSFDLCEESCRLKNPVSVNGLTATLFDAECMSDHAGRTSERMFFLRYMDQVTGAERGLMASANGTTELFRCDAPQRTQAAGGAIDIESTIAEFYRFDDDCRGGPGDATETWEACGERNATARLLNRLGYCLGTQDQAAFEYQWQVCGPNSNYAPEP